MADVLFVACAVIEDAKGRVLAARRAPNRMLGGLWEFPGGKIREGETAEACIHREIDEEFGGKISIIARLPDCLHHYPEQSVCLIPFVCRAENPDDFQALEHQAVRLCSNEELLALDWCAADVAVLQHYIAWKSARNKSD